MWDRYLLQAIIYTVVFKATCTYTHYPTFVVCRTQSLIPLMPSPHLELHLYFDSIKTVLAVTQLRVLYFVCVRIYPLSLQKRKCTCIRRPSITNMGYMCVCGVAIANQINHTVYNECTDN